MLKDDTSMIKKNKIKKIFAVLSFLALTAIFLFVGMAIVHSSPAKDENGLWVQVLGYDSNIFLVNFCYIKGIGMLMFRHPFMTVIFTPIFALGSTLYERVGFEVAQIGILSYFAVFGSACVFLLYFILKRVGATMLQIFCALSLYLSFAHVYLLGGMAESFGFSMMLLLLALLLVAYEIKTWKVFLPLAVFTSCVTLTNGIKPAVAWLLTVPKENIKELPFKRLCLVVLIVGIVGFLACSAQWIWIDGFGVLNGIKGIIGDISSWMTKDNEPITFSKRIWLIWQTFFCEPMMLHGQIINVSYITKGYSTWYPHIAAIIVLLLSVCSAIVNFKHRLIRALLAMIAFDFLLHGVIGWGIDEGQIYCGHWFFALPILIGFLPGRLALLSLPATIIIVAQNIYTIITLSFAVSAKQF